jgi:hypothetical protein
LREVDREELSWLQANLKAFNGRGIREEEGLEGNRQAAFEDLDPNLVLSVIQADLQDNSVNSYLLGPDQQFSQMAEHTPGEERETRGGHRHLQIGRMLDIDLISEPPTPSPP